MATHVIVDGSNIATEGRNLPSLTQLDEAVRAFLAERPHEHCIVVVDATFEHRVDDSERSMYEDAVEAGELITPPAGTIGRGDKFILEIADRVDATVFSNDSFQEFHGEYEWLFSDGRLVGGKPVPGVGWVFAERSPVRGPRSRAATRASKQRASSPVPDVPSATPRRRRASATADSGEHRTSTASTAKATRAPRAAKAAKTVKAPASVTPAPVDGTNDDGRRRAAPMNGPLAFIQFIAAHPLGSEVVGEVVEFSSHGAYITVGDVRCYIALRQLGDPAPRAAREVLRRGEIRSFVVHALDGPRRGIDLALTGGPAGSTEVSPVLSDADDGAATGARRGRRSRSAVSRSSVQPTATTDAGPGASLSTDKVPAVAGATRPESEATHAMSPVTKKAPAKKAPAKKAPAKKAPAKKAPAKKAPAKKAPAKKAPSKKAPAKKAPAKKAPAKKAPAKKAPAKKVPAKKAPAKKAPARKAPARKAPARKAPATRR